METVDANDADIDEGDLGGARDGGLVILSCCSMGR